MTAEEPAAAPPSHLQEEGAPAPSVCSPPEQKEVESSVSSDQSTNNGSSLPQESSCDILATEKNSDETKNCVADLAVSLSENKIIGCGDSNSDGGDDEVGAVKATLTLSRSPAASRIPSRQSSQPQQQQAAASSGSGGNGGEAASLSEDLRRLEYRLERFMSKVRKKLTVFYGAILFFSPYFGSSSSSGTVINIQLNEESYVGGSSLFFLTWYRYLTSCLVGTTRLVILLKSRKAGIPKRIPM